MSLDTEGTFVDAADTAAKEAQPQPGSAPDPRYPIGKPPVVAPGERVSDETRAAAIDTLARFPELLRNAVQGLSTHALDTPYREGGWTVRQVVHHVADSHATAVFRFRMTLTTDTPTLSGYPEADFARLHDYLHAPVEWSLEIIEATHARWVMLLQSLGEEQWSRRFVHAERGPSTLEAMVLLYAWHSQHHLAHITHLRAARGW